MASRDGDELQIPTKSELELIDERNLNLSTAVPTVVVTNTVASGRDTPAVTVAIPPIPLPLATVFETLVTTIVGTAVLRLRVVSSSLGLELHLCPWMPLK